MRADSADATRDHAESFRIFLSYARVDSSIATGLVSPLVRLSYEVFVDTSNIPHGAEWREMVRFEIERSIGVVCFVTKAWLASAACREELEMAQDRNKRLLPIVHEVSVELLPDSLSKLQLAFMRSPSEAEVVAAGIDASLRVNLDWLLVHRGLLLQADDWERSKKSKARLLPSSVLHEIDEALLTKEQPEPALNALQQEFLGASRTQAISKRRAIQFVGLGFVAVAVIIGLYIANQKKTQNTLNNLANARAFVAEANRLFQRRDAPQAALRLGLAARQQAEIEETDEFLRKAISLSPQPTAIFSLDETNSVWIKGASYDDQSNSFVVAGTLPQEGTYIVGTISGTSGETIATAKIPTSMGKLLNVSAYRARGVFVRQFAGTPGAGTGDTAEIGVIDLLNQKQIGTIRISGRGAVHASLDPLGRFLAVGKGEVLVVRDLESSASKSFTLSREGLSLGDLCVHPEGNLVFFKSSTGRNWGFPVCAIRFAHQQTTVTQVMVAPYTSLGFSMSPDGRLVAVASDAGQVRLFDTTNLLEVGRIATPAGGVGVESVHWSRDGKIVALKARSLELFDSASHKSIAVVDTSLGFSSALMPSGKDELWTVSGSVPEGWPAAIRWNLEKADEFRRDKTALPPGQRYFAFDFTGQGSEILAFADRSITALDAATGDVRWSQAISNRVIAWDARRARIHEVSFAVGSEKALNMGDKPLDPATFSRVLAPRGRKLTRTSLSPDGKLLLGYSGTPEAAFFSVHEAATGALIEERWLPADETTFEFETAAISQAGVAAAFRYRDGPAQRLSLLNLTNLASEAAFTERSNPLEHVHALAFSRDSKSLIIATRLGLESLSTKTLRTEYSINWRVKGAQPDAIGISRDGFHVACPMHSGVITVYNLNTRKFEARVSVDEDPRGKSYLRFSRDGVWLAVNAGGANGLATFIRENGSQRRSKLKSLSAW